MRTVMVWPPMFITIVATFRFFTPWAERSTFGNRPVIVSFLAYF